MPLITHTSALKWSARLTLSSSLYLTKLTSPLRMKAMISSAMPFDASLNPQTTGHSFTEPPIRLIRMMSCLLAIAPLLGLLACDRQERSHQVVLGLRGVGRVLDDRELDERNL